MQNRATPCAKKEEVEKEKERKGGNERERKRERTYTYVGTSNFRRGITSPHGDLRHSRVGRNRGLTRYRRTTLLPQ